MAQLRPYRGRRGFSTSSFRLAALRLRYCRLGSASSGRRRALCGLLGLAHPARTAVVRALRGADRLAGRPLPRMRRATAGLRLGPRRGRVRWRCAALRPCLEGARPPPRGRPRCRARGGAHRAAGGRRHHVYPAGRRPLPDPRPPSGRAPRAPPRQRVGARRRAAPRARTAVAAAGRACHSPSGGGTSAEPSGRRARCRRASLLVDDVYTTGATCAAAASALRAGGARHIQVITFARAVR